MECNKTEWTRLKMKRYKTSLDFPCNFCGGNSYDNLHFEKDGQLIFVICYDCIREEWNKEEAKTK